MRKHFLILALMALLPLAGWAETYTVQVRAKASEIQFGVATPETATADMFLVTSWGEITDEDAKTAITAAIPEKLTVATERTPDSNVGNYGFTLSVLAGEYVEYVEENEKDYIFIEIANANGTFKQIKSTATPTLTAPTATTEDLTYTGDTEHPFSLLTENGSATVGLVGNIALEYAVKKGEGEYGAWSADAPQVVDAGTYTVKYRAATSENYNSGEGTEMTAITVNKANAAFTIAPAAIENLTYTPDVAQALITEGTVNAGEAQYKLGDGEYGTAVPTATAADEYTVWYKIVGNDNYNDLAEQSLTVTIGKAAATLVEAPAAVANLTYDGSDQALVTAGSATNGTIQFSTTGEDGSWSATIPTGKNAKTYKVYYKVVGDENYGDVAAIDEPLQVTIAKLSIVDGEGNLKEEFTVKNEPAATYDYDGTEHKPAVYLKYGTANVSGTATGRVYDGDQTNVTAKGFTTTVTANGNYEGSYTWTSMIVARSIEGNDDITATINGGAAVVYDGNEKTPEIAINDALATLTTADLAADTDYEIASWANNTNVGTASVTISGKGNYTGEKTFEFQIVNAPAYIIPTTAVKLFGEQEPPLTYTVQDAEGNTLENSALKGTVELARVAGENIGKYIIYVKSYTAGENENYTVANVQNDPNNTTEANKTAIFFINKNDNAILTLKFTDATAASKVYDGTAAAPDYNEGNLEIVKGALAGDTWETLKGSATVTVDALSAKDVADNYQLTATVTGLTNYASVVVQPLTFAITARPITITATDQTIAQGAAIDQEAYTITSGSIVEGDDLHIVLSTEKIEVGGPYADAITVTAENSNYNITKMPGSLTITGTDAPEFVLDGTDNNKIKAYHNQEVTTVNVLIKRHNEFNSGTTKFDWGQYQWNTIVLPFDVTVRELSNAFGYAIVNTYDQDNTDASKAAFKLTMGSITANTPFLLKSDEAIPAEGKVITFENKTIKYAEAADMKLPAANGITMCGTYTQVDVSKETPNYMVYISEAAADPVNPVTSDGNTYHVYPFAAYFESTTASARSLSVTVQEADGSTTFIGAINADKAFSGEGWYTLSGTKLDAAPTVKGVYINNGKKVVIK